MKSKETLPKPEALGADVNRKYAQALKKLPESKATRNHSLEDSQLLEIGIRLASLDQFTHGVDL